MDTLSGICTLLWLAEIINNAIRVKTIESYSQVENPVNASSKGTEIIGLPYTQLIKVGNH